jgi:hypothetical protein
VVTVCTDVRAVREEREAREDEREAYLDENVIFRRDGHGMILDELDSGFGESSGDLAPGLLGSGERHA